MAEYMFKLGTDLSSQSKCPIFQTVEISLWYKIQWIFSSPEVQIQGLKKINFPIKSVFIRRLFFFFFFEKQEFPWHQECSGLSKHCTAYTSVSYIHLPCLKMRLWSHPKFSWLVNKGCLCKPSEKMFAVFSSITGVGEQRGEKRSCSGSAQLTDGWDLSLISHQKHTWSVFILYFWSMPCSPDRSHCQLCYFIDNQQESVSLCVNCVVNMSMRSDFVFFLDVSQAIARLLMHGN